MTFTLNANIWIQCLLTVLQALFQFSSANPELKHIGLLLQILIVILTSLKAHVTNPDGTAAEKAEKKKDS